VFTALLDTNVLWPSAQRDFLLSLGFEGVYRPIWSDAVLDELQFHEARKLTSRGVGEADAECRAAHLIARMRSSFGDAIVVGWERLEGSYGLPDPNDEHVVAAAELGGAGAIVTLNLKDFPADRIPTSIRVLPPAAFALEQASLNPPAAMRAVDQLAARSGAHGPSRSADDILDLLDARYGMADAVEVIRAAARP